MQTWKTPSLVTHPTCQEPTGNSTGQLEEHFHLFFFFLFPIYYFASLTFASGSGMIWDWCTGWKHHEITGTLSLSAGRLWDGCWEAMHCSAAPVCVHCRSRLMGRGQIKVPPGSCMQRMSAWIVCRGVLLFQTVFLEQ